MCRDRFIVSRALVTSLIAFAFGCTLHVKLCTVSPPTSSAAREPGEATTCTPSVAYGLGVTRRFTGACSASTSPILRSFHQIVKLAAHG